MPQMTGKRRLIAYLSACLMMTVVEYFTNSTDKSGLGMSMFYQVGMLGLAGVHFGGVAVDKFRNGKNDGEPK